MWKERVTRISPMRRIVLLAVITLLCWSVIFSSTYRYSFFWDDLHLIRPYSWEEIRSTFHGRHDPEKIEWPALRPLTTLLFCFQGASFGENVVFQRIFMTGLMGVLLAAIGLLLCELGLSLPAVTVVFALFASSRVFASLLLWITLGSLILCYISMILAAYFYLLWLKRERLVYFALTLGFTALTIFTREEAYTLPVVLPLLWIISSSRRTNWRRALAGAGGVLAILAIHFVLRKIFIPEAPPVRFSSEAIKDMLVSFKSAWLPGGLQMVGHGDRLIGLLWKGFLGALLLLLLRASSNRALAQVSGALMLGIILCAPALGQPRTFGTAMPTLAFFTAISVACMEVLHRIQLIPFGQRLWRTAILICLMLGLILGVAGGIRRSIYVAEALHENSAMKVSLDGESLFDLYGKSTIPSERRQAGLTRLAAFGIRSPEQLRQFQLDLQKNPGYRKNRKTKSALFLPKYDYQSF
jgi:hypothetical protein